MIFLESKKGIIFDKEAVIKADESCSNNRTYDDSKFSVKICFRSSGGGGEGEGG